MYRHQAEELQKLSTFAAIALATAAIEKVIATAAGHGDVASLLQSLMDELWQWQQADKISGKANMSQQDAEALPSSRLYDSYTGRLLVLADKYSDQERVLNLIGATIANLSFILWRMDRSERAMNPGKPIVLGSDIAEVDWDVFVTGLETAVAAAADPGSMFDWQKKALQRLAAEQPGSLDSADMGRPVAREYFD